MKASELKAELERAITKNGDMDIVISIAQPNCGYVSSEPGFAVIEESDGKPEFIIRDWPY